MAVCRSTKTGGFVTFSVAACGRKPSDSLTRKASSEIQNGSIVVETFVVQKEADLSRECVCRAGRNLYRVLYRGSFLGLLGKLLACRDRRSSNTPRQLLYPEPF